MANLLLEAKSRTSDPDTSQAAALAVTRMTSKRLAVLRLFELSGEMTDEQLLDRYRSRSRSRGWPEQSESGLRTRRCELIRMGQLQDTGRTRRMTTGRMAKIWGVIEGEQQ